MSTTDDNSVRVIPVIESRLTKRGKGTEEAPTRIITEYFTLAGGKLAEFDPVQNEKLLAADRLYDAAMAALEVREVAPVNEEARFKCVAALKSACAAYKASTSFL